MSKHFNWHRQLCNQARRNRTPLPPRPRMWIVSPGRPRSLLVDLGMKPMQHWPAGFWHMAGTIHAHVIVIRDLPACRDTLLLRLLGQGKQLQRALAELDELPPSSPLRHRLVEMAVAWRQEMFDTTSEVDMIYPETKARYAAWKAKAIDEGIKKGRREGKREGERTLVRKLLVLRFGELPADAERRLERASLAKLERWAERVLTAKNLAAVFAD